MQDLQHCNAVNGYFMVQLEVWGTTPYLIHN